MAFPKKWKPQRFYFEKPLLPKANFICTFLAFVCDEKAREIAGEPLEMSGEFLPIKVEGESGEYWIYNVTNCINVVDAERSEWRKLGPGPGERMLMKPAFMPSRFGEESIFKIPEDGEQGFTVSSTPAIQTMASSRRWLSIMA